MKVKRTAVGRRKRKRNTGNLVKRNQGKVVIKRKGKDLEEFLFELHFNSIDANLDGSNTKVYWNGRCFLNKIHSP